MNPIKIVTDSTVQLSKEEQENEINKYLRLWLAPKLSSISCLTKKMQTIL